MTGNGWLKDPLNRGLRVVAIVAFIGLLVLVVADPNRSGDFPLDLLLIGAILVGLGYPVALQMPGLITRATGRTPTEEVTDGRDA